MALAFMKFVRTTESTNIPFWLTGIVESFMVKYEMAGGRVMSASPSDEWSEEFDSLRGQYTGFFNQLYRWLQVATNMGSELDRITETDLLKAANDGLRFDSGAFMASLDDETDTSTAKETAHG